jgi:hypothetical protein
LDETNREVCFMAMIIVSTAGGCKFVMTEKWGFPVKFVRELPSLAGYR